MNNKELLIEDISSKWNAERFKYIRKPEYVSEVESKEDFDKSIRSVLDMPIKIPHSDIRIPIDLKTKSILEIVDKVIKFEKEINNNYEDYYMYLTVHHSDVQAGTSQRRLGAHIDGMQGERYKDKLKVCHSYLVSNEVPTCFFIQEFPTNLCDKTQNWFYEFDKVKDYNKSMLSKPYEINLMTAYNVHESTESTVNTLRTFVRIEFSLKEFNRIGNTINEEFKLDWEYEDRSIPPHLKLELFD